MKTDSNGEPGLFSRIASLSESKPWSNPLVIGLVFGSLALWGYGASSIFKGPAVATAFLVAGAALASGTVLGFLFGVPRVMQESNVTADNVLRGHESLYQVNTNLEQISDWLTKIIVGVGLVQLKQIPGMFVSVANFCASSFTPSAPPSVAAVILLYFGSLGFMLSYLWTRLLLTQEFTRADRAARQSPEFYEGFVQALLYQPAPSGFTSAIEIGERYVKEYGSGNWRIWRSLACAYGQRFDFLTRTGQASGKQESRDRALEALKSVLAISPQECESMKRLWDPSLATPQEDDLTPFYADPEFKKLFDGDAHSKGINTP